MTRGTAERAQSIRTIDYLTRLNSSAYGNPRYRVHFTDGSSAITQSDAMFCYGIENPDMRGLVRVTWTRAGRIAHLSPVAYCETCQLHYRPRDTSEPESDWNAEHTCH